MKSRFKYPLLMVAMDYRQKEFVAHPNVQQMLDCIWIGDWIDWEKYSQPYKFFIILSRIFLLPWITIVTLCLQKSRSVLVILLRIHGFYGQTLYGSNIVDKSKSFSVQP